MIKFAVTRPKQRLQAIAEGITMLKWHQDPYLSHYGISVDPNLTVVSTRMPLRISESDPL
jgi:eukaryotic translation initiation factor 2C